LCFFRLKRIVTSEYACMACLGVLFLVSVIIAFLLVFKTVPIVEKDKVLYNILAESAIFLSLTPS
jgi:hypothetical protein